MSEFPARRQVECGVLWLQSHSPFLTNSLAMNELRSEATTMNRNDLKWRRTGN